MEHQRYRSELFTVGNQSAADDTLTFYSVQDAFGSDQFTLTLTDSDGGTDSILVTLTVNSVNDDPVIQNPSTIQSDPSWSQDEELGNSISISLHSNPTLKMRKLRSHGQHFGHRSEPFLCRKPKCSR